MHGLLGSPCWRQGLAGNKKLKGPETSGRGWGRGALLILLFPTIGSGGL